MTLNLVPRVLSYTRETLENAGHMSPRRNENPGGVLVSESFVATKFCKHQNETHFTTSLLRYLLQADQSAIVNSSYWNITTKPKQVKCLEAVYRGKDAVGVLPAGYRKSVIPFHLLQAGLFFFLLKSVLERNRRNNR